MPRLPESIGKYKVLHRLGKGGMSLVYKGEHPTLKMPLVLKKLNLKGDRVYRERFLREASLMMSLRQENLVSLFDHFKERSGSYLVLEYVEGKTLGELLSKEGALPLPEALWLMTQVARGLAYTHEKGIVHRDVKPSNIFLGKDGSVKLGDFGIACRPEGEDVLTSSGVSLGTPAFMPPEQLEDSRNADFRADVWSFGVTLFELVTGERFVTGPSAAAVGKILPEAAKNWPRRLPPGTPGSLRKLLRGCLRLSPEKRFSTGSELVFFLEKRGAGKGRPASLERRLEDFLGPSPREASSPKKDLPPGEGPPPPGEKEPPSPGAKPPRRKNPLKRTLFLKKSSQPSSPVRGQVSRGSLWPGLFFFLGGLAGAVLFFIPIVRTEIFLSRRYGSLSLEITPSPEAPDFWAGGAGARLYRESAGTLHPLKTPGLRRGKDNILSSRRLYLPAGAYRVRWDLGDQIAWQSFFLTPLQVRRSAGEAPLVIKTSLGDPPVFPLTLVWQARNAVSGEDITPQARVDGVQDSGETWLAWEDFPRDSFLSGRRYRFRVQAPGYFDAHFSVTPSPWRREIHLDAALYPRPGNLAVMNASEREVFPRLNGERRYFGLKDGEFASLPLGSLAPGESADYVLFPGNYQLTPGRGLQGGVTLNLESGAQRGLSIVMDSDGNLLFR